MEERGRVRDRDVLWYSWDMPDGVRWETYPEFVWDEQDELRPKASCLHPHSREEEQRSNAGLRRVHVR